MNKPLVIYGGSHGLQGKQKLRIRKYFQYLINHSILCTVRDPRAKEIFVLNGVNAEKIHVFPDPAVLLEPCEDARVLEILMDEKIPKTKGTPLFGLIPVQGGKSGRCLRECFLSTGGSPEATYQRRVQLWVEIIEHLLKVTNAHFVFIPHCIGPSVDNDDRRMSRAIYETIPGDRHRLTFIETEYSPDELKGLMKHCDYVLGERAHGLIGAVTVGTPCMALTTKSDLRMFNIIQKMFGRIVFDLTDPDVDELKELLTDEWNRRAETALKMREKANEIRKEGIHAAELLSQRIHEACDIKIFDRSSVVTRR